jgi:hypothetical protein
MPTLLDRAEYLTTADAAKLLAVSPVRVRQLVACGDLTPAVVSAYGSLYARDAVEQLAHVRAERRSQTQTANS